jgi:prepilin-type N-terminal cleavage/methylation domain-containing protein
MIPLPPQLNSPRARGGFTLVEVMISIAIALVLILGVSQIFSMAQRTTGAGIEVLADTETNRGIQQMLLNDARGVTNAVGDSPGLVILSYATATFRNRADQQQDNDGNPQTINDPVNPTATINESIAAIDDRVHRTDVLGFFARGKFTRRTGDGMTGSPFSLTAPTTSDEAFIWYGHLALPDNNEITKWDYLKPGAPTTTPKGQFWNPGCADPTLNPNNFFASDWVLGRQVILLSPRGSSSPEPHIRGISESTPQNPLWLQGSSSSVASDNNIPLYASRYDLADASIAAYRNALGGGTNWWQGLTGWDPSKPQQTRFDGNPFARKPATASMSTGADIQQLSAAIAQMSPIFVRGCTQFVVEFAGDYVTQNASGTIGTTDSSGRTTLGGSDGQIDYYVDNNGTHQIRWYGFPRDSAADGGPVATTPSTPGDGGVFPVGLVFKNAGVTPPAGWLVGGNLAFERLSANSYVWPASANTDQTNGLPAWSTGPYACAWGTDTDALNIPRPKMLRITIGIDDPTGHLNTQQVYEYVVNLP